MTESQVYNVIGILIPAAGIWALLRCLLPAYFIDKFRSRLFELRGEIFQFAANGNIAFDHPTYTTLRSTINGAGHMRILSFCMFLLSSTLGAQVDLNEVTIPRKTEIFVKLERALSSKTSVGGERFHGRIEVPVTMNDQIIVPAGSFILGQVESVHKPGYFKGTGEVELSFDTLIFPNGTTRQLKAIPQSVEEHKMGTGFDERKIKANSEQADEVIKAATIGAASGGAVGGATDGINGLGIGSAVGAATGAIVGLLFRGKHLTLPKGTSLTIQLEHDARFVAP